LTYHTHFYHQPSQSY